MALLLRAQNYSAASGTLSFAPGVTTQSVSVQTMDDGAATGNLAFSIVLSNPTGSAVLSQASAVGTIIDAGATQAPLPSMAGTYTLTSEVLPLDYGFTTTGYMDDSVGSISPSTTPDGYQVIGLYQFAAGISLELKGFHDNSGWNSIYVPGVGTLLRSDAQYILDNLTTNTTGWSPIYNVPASSTVIIQ